MDPINSSDLQVFVAVVREGSFTRAAALLDTRKSHASRVVTRLEESLGATLLHRTTRSLSLTEVGRDVFERSVAILEAMDETVAAVQRTKTAPSGVLRVTCGTEFGLLAVNSWVASYLLRYPDVRVEVEFSNRVVDIVHEGFDVAIRVGALRDSALAARKLGDVHFGLFASRSYLRRAGRLRGPGDLPRHQLVLSRQTRDASGSWTINRGDSARTLALTPRLLVNTHMAVRDAIAADVGVGLLPRFQVRELVEAEEVVALLPHWSRAPVAVHAVFPSSRFLAPKVRAFVDHALLEFEKTVAAASTRAAR